jgi:hypothetical protein
LEPIAHSRPFSRPNLSARNVVVARLFQLFSYSRTLPILRYYGDY